MQLRRSIRRAALLAGVLGLGALAGVAPAAAHGRVFFGVGIAPVPFFAPVPYPAFGFYGPPVFGPPVFAPPIYAPPPVYAYAPPVGGQTCYAGAYVCPLNGPAYAGQPCACNTRDGRQFGGRVGG